MMKISIVTDEISADVETAIELGTEWGIHDFELRGFGTQRVPLFSDFQKTRILELLEEYGARVVAISPGLFKIPYSTRNRERFPLQVIDSTLYQKWRDVRSLVDYHIQELLPASIEYAKEVGAGKIIVFSFMRGSNPVGPAPDEILECLEGAAQQAKKANVELMIEVEDQFWADTGDRTAKIIQAINCPALGVNWDPGNAFAAGDIPYPNGYHAIQDFVHHIHFKDLLRTPAEGIRYVIDGEIDWAGQLRALAADGYRGFISVEPHMQPKVASAKAAFYRLKMLIEAISEGISK
jgi:sugar phosphate isomerase/epimerase